MRTYSSFIVRFLLISVILFIGSSSLVSAQNNGENGGIDPGETKEQPKTRVTSVSAIVSDLVPPSTPILISPLDTSKLKTGTVEFVWKESTDNWLMDHYTLVVNGTVLFDNIPLEDISTPEYELTYDIVTGYYTLKPTASFNDGSYTWNVIAWDYHGNQATSVIWKFSIDTKAPDFAIIKIEDKVVDINTGNVASVPSEPIELDANEPVLSGTGEANSIVNLTINYPDGNQDEITFTIGGDGNWSINLGTLNRDVKILLNFLITDPTGNVSILNNVPLILKTEYVEVIVPPIGVVIPIKPPLDEYVTPVPDDGGYVIEIPVLPPAEYLPPVIRELPERFNNYVRNTTPIIRESFLTSLSKLLFFILLLLLTALPLLKLLLLSIWHRYYFSWQLFKEFLWLIGWSHEKNPQGIVVTRDTQTPIEHSLVLISGKTIDQTPVHYSFITNEYGIFPYTNLAYGEYRLSIHHPNFFFPSLSKVPEHLSWNTFYTGALFTVKNGSTIPLLVLPVEPLQKQEHSWSYEARKAILLAPALTLPLLILSICICLAFPSLLNILALIVYAFLWFKKKIVSRSAKAEVETTDLQKVGIPKVIVSLQKEDKLVLQTIVQTNDQGIGHFRCSPDVYSVTVVDFKHSLTEGDNKTTTSFKADTSKDYLPLILDN